MSRVCSGDGVTGDGGYGNFTSDKIFTGEVTGEGIFTGEAFLTGEIYLGTLQMPLIHPLHISTRLSSSQTACLKPLL